jgi:hypothetical protein
MTIWNFGYDIPEDQLAEIKGAGWLAGDNLHELMALAYRGLTGCVRPPTPIDTVNVGSNGRCLPLVEGGYIQLPEGSAGVFTKYNDAGVSQWTVNPAAINAAATGMVPVVWYDTVDGMLWAMAKNTADTPDTIYSGKVNATTGAVTAVGSCSLDGIATTSFALSYFRSDALGSGNLILSWAFKKYVFSSANGSLVSGPTDEKLGGVAPAGLLNSGYHTADETLHIAGAMLGISGDGMQIGVYRGGAFGVYQTTSHVFGAVGNADGAILPWGPNKVALAASNQLTCMVYGPRIFERTDFDRWLHDVADVLGLPQA